MLCVKKKGEFGTHFSSSLTAFVVVVHIFFPYVSRTCSVKALNPERNHCLLATANICIEPLAHTDGGASSLFSCHVSSIRCIFIRMIMMTMMAVMSMCLHKCRYEVDRKRGICSAERAGRPRQQEQIGST